MKCVIIQNDIVSDIKELTDDQIQEHALRCQAILDYDTTSPKAQIGWPYKNGKVNHPQNWDQVTIIQETILKPAKTFGIALKDKMVSENIALGITQAGKTRLIGEVADKLDFWLRNGSLYEALVEIEIIRSIMTPEMSPFITNARLDSLRLDIMKYVGLA